MKYSASILLKPGLDTRIIDLKKSDVYSKLKKLFVVDESAVYEELNNAPDILLRVHTALKKCGLTNLVRITHDETDFYLDLKDVPNDLNSVMTEFNVEMQSRYERFYEDISLVIEDTVDEIDYSVCFRMMRVHYRDAFPLRFQIVGTPVNVDVEKKEERFRLFVSKLEQNIRKYMQVGLFRLQFSIPAGYEEDSVTKREDIDAEPGYAEKIDVQAQANCQFFPLYGVTLGETPVSRMKELGTKAKDINERTRKPYDYYVINGMNFWHSNNIASHTYMTYTDPMPDIWAACGLDWKLSYDHFRSLMKRNGFLISDVDRPHNELYSGKLSLTAEFHATKKINSTTQLCAEFQFSYSQKRGTKTKGTIYSIRMRGN